MTKFNPNNWSLEDVIKQRVNLEAEFEHANYPIPELPKYVKPPKASNMSVGWLNFIKVTLNELRP